MRPAVSGECASDEHGLCEDPYCGCDCHDWDDDEEARGQ